MMEVEDLRAGGWLVADRMDLNSGVGMGGGGVPGLGEGSGGTQQFINGTRIRHK